MSTKKSAYKKLIEKFGEPTFSEYLEAIVVADFESKSACARKLGMSPQSLQDYLTGKRTPSPSLAAKMAEKLGYLPISFIELALTQSVQKAGYNYRVNLESA